jgi:hypothetical protein
MIQTFILIIVGGRARGALRLAPSRTRVGRRRAPARCRLRRSVKLYMCARAAGGEGGCGDKRDTSVHSDCQMRTPLYCKSGERSRDTLATGHTMKWYIQIMALNELQARITF